MSVHINHRLIPLIVDNFVILDDGEIRLHQAVIRGTSREDIALRSINDKEVVNIGQRAIIVALTSSDTWPWDRSGCDYVLLPVSYAKGMLIDTGSRLTSRSSELSARLSLDRLDPIFRLCLTTLVGIIVLLVLLSLL